MNQKEAIDRNGLNFFPIIIIIKQRTIPLNDRSCGALYVCTYDVAKSSKLTWSVTDPVRPLAVLSIPCAPVKCMTLGPWRLKCELDWSQVC